MTEPLIRAPELPRDVPWLNTGYALGLEELGGHVVLLWFFTSSSAHCRAVASTIVALEQAFTDRAFLCIGSHSPRFAEERDPAVAREALRRLGLRHPVLVDENRAVFRRYRCRAWPSFVLIDAGGHVRFHGAGEPDRDRMQSAIQGLLDEAAAEGDEPYGSLSSGEFGGPVPRTGLRFPAGVAFDARRGLLWVADTGHHRVFSVNPETGEVDDCVGTGEPGGEDGAFHEATFASPEALLLVGDELFVADTGNHTVRRIAFGSRQVETVLGTGRPAVDREGGAPGVAQPIHSPAGLAWHEGVLYVALAAMHQIWRLTRETGIAEPFVGTGEYGQLDAPRKEASLAQPVGLAYADGRLWFTDSDANSLRYVEVEGGDVRTVLRGGIDRGAGLPADHVSPLRNPRGIATHGDRILVADAHGKNVWSVGLDGSAEVLPLDVRRPEAIAASDGVVFVADPAADRVLRRAGESASELLVRGLPPAPTAFGTDYAAAPPLRLPPQADVTLRVPALPVYGKLLQPGTRAALDVHDIDGDTLPVEVSLAPDLDGPWFMARGIATGSSGAGVWRLRLVYNTVAAPGRVCHPHELRVEVPVELVEGADAEATLLLDR